ncbi:MULTISPECIES: NUDIX domain-containing protein [Streptomyces]|uniref:Predicted NTP pyrophosphohydrolase, NUDIX family n=1 Tax=Streptomyces yunnanensis TaxID=156453 RepID=A0A9X8QXG3_9ACTN|nr:MULTISPECIES: NUDIX domain-containing protein [Streptomyces]QRX91056.1 NUDIX domain-containing protein [Streptomyces noursei]UJB40905.1 NUDIX domain-containing protein [Streptomyces sp. A1-5]SHM85285.1 Predicted NTP pyrophosphohydrolase, NUDIX family [Streptomyces yunnanensis]
MAGKRSAGLLLHRSGADGGTEVLLAHMGGPLWARRDAGAWSVPKGEYAPPEEPLAAARREFAEELGMPPPDGRYVPLGDVRQSGGKVVTVWAVAGDLDPDRIEPGTFELEWPRGSGVIRSFPEIDRVAWCTPQQARARLVTAQREFLDRLAEALAAGRADAG